MKEVVENKNNAYIKVGVEHLIINLYLI